jgi:hypothetical protein
MPATAWDLFCSDWFSVFSHWLTANSSFNHRSLLTVGLAMLGGFVVLCKVYFFSAPLAGISISLTCYVASMALSRA